jgi:essential nuclear protein 1
MFFFFSPMPRDDKKNSQKLLPLHVQLKQDQEVVVKQKAKKEKVVNQDSIVSHKQTKKILQMAREQQQEMEETEKIAIPQIKLVAPVQESDQESENEQEYEEFFGQDQEFMAIDEKDQELVKKFMNPTKKNINLSEIIMQKINEKPQELDQTDEMNPKVIEVYTKVGMLLSRYKSGPLPKTFKILPTLRDWERVLYITAPHAWTPQAMYEATRIFTSNLKSKMAQRFFNLILLERVRDDIQENTKLNYHLYMSVKKSLYKPAAFFKGFLLPLLEDGCTLKEAAIVGSVLVKVCKLG